MKKLIILLLLLASPAWAVEPIDYGKPFELSRSNPYVLGAGGAAAGTANCGGAGSGIGYSDPTTEDDSNQNYYITTQVTVASACIANKIRMYGRYSVSAQDVIMAIYSDTGSDLPGNLLAYTAATALGGSDAWVSASLNTPVTFSAGKYHLLMIVSGGYYFKYTATGSVSTYQGSASYPTLNNPYGDPTGTGTRKLRIEAYYE